MREHEDGEYVEWDDAKKYIRAVKDARVDSHELHARRGLRFPELGAAGGKL